MKDNKINAIVSLLEDDSSEVRRMMADQLKSFSMDDLQLLCEKARDINIEVSLHLEEIRQDKLYEHFVVDLKKKIADNELDMESLTVFLSRFINPSIKESDVVLQITELTESCQEFLDEHYDLDRGVALAKFLGTKLKFTGNKKQYYAVGNSSISCLLESKKALPITLSALYIIVGDRLGIDIRGIALPSHFIVGVFDNDDDVTYINPFDSGKVINLETCRAIARRAGYPFSEDMMEPVGSRVIFMRMLNNLKYVYSRENKQFEMNKIQKLVKVWTERVFRQVP
ncbi:MAG: transglutaminase-like domain-containing protein [Lentisphaeraceae bacterium]|nr:transglutaminase-like domain-containing protein [Lentisphaeraceae bacterium]